jgi:hypothetical protein
MKPTTLVYCGEDGEAGKALAASLRDGTSYVVMCAANSFVGADRHADRVAFTSDVPQRLRQAISAAHGVPADVPGMPSIMQAISPKKRGWPKGKPRKEA